MLKWAGTNPVYIGVVILFGAGFIMAYPLATLLVLTVVAAGIGFVRWMIRLDKRRLGTHPAQAGVDRPRRLRTLASDERGCPRRVRSVPALQNEVKPPTQS